MEAHKIEKERRRKKSGGGSNGSGEESPIRPKASSRSPAGSPVSRNNRKTWSPSDFSAADAEELELMIAADAAHRTSLLLVSP
jgi:hypothetical protein